MRISTETAERMLLGLRALDGYERVIKDGERERVVQELYKLGGGLRFQIAKDIAKLTIVADALHKARNDLVRGLSGGKDRIPPEKAGEFYAEERAMLDAQQDIELSMIQVEELKLDQNPIPGSILALLAPLLS